MNLLFGVTICELMVFTKPLLRKCYYLKNRFLKSKTTAVTQSSLLTEYIKAGNQMNFLTGSYLNLKSFPQYFKVKSKPFFVPVIVCGVTVLSMLLSNFCKYYGSNAEFKGDIRVLTTTLFLLNSWITVVSWAYVMSQNGNGVSAIVYSIAKFEQQQHQNNMPRWWKYRLLLVNIFCKIIRFGAIISSVLCTSIAIVMPNLPFNVLNYQPYNWIYQSMDDIFTIINIPGVWASGFIHAMRIGGIFWHWQIAAKVAQFTIIQVVVLTTCIFSVMVSYKQKLIIIFRKKCSKPHKERLLRDHRLVYCQLQIILNMFNEVHSVILFILLAAAVLCQVLALSSLLGYKNIVSSKYMEAIYLLAAIDCTVVITCLFGMCGSIHNTSKSCLNFMDCDIETKKSKIYQRCLMSLPPIKITFGSSNFIDKLTPIIFQEFAIRRSIDVLLLS